MLSTLSLESNQNFILFIIFIWMVRSLVRTTPIKQGSLPTSRVGLTLFGRVYSSYLKRKDKKIPKFWDHGSQKICTNRDHFILHWDFSRKILPFLYLYRFILLDIMVDVPYSNLTPSGPLSKICKRNGVVVIELATTEFWLKSSKPLQILDQSRTIISRRSQMPFGYSVPLTMVRLRTSNVHSWTEFLSLIAELRARSAPAE